MLISLENPKKDQYMIGPWCSIPAKKDIKNLFFYHGKITNFEYNYVKDFMSNIYLLKIN